MTFNFFGGLNFYVQYIPFKLGKLKNYLEGKKDKAKSLHEARYSRMRIMKVRLVERFESISFQFAWFSHKLYIKLFQTLETFYLSRFFNCFFKKPCFQPEQNAPWTDEMTRARLEPVQA